MATRRGTVMATRTNRFTTAGKYTEQGIGSAGKTLGALNLQRGKDQGE